MHGISVRFFQSRVHAKYASHPQFAPEPLQPMFLPGTADADLIEMTFVTALRRPPPDLIREFPANSAPLRSVSSATVILQAARA
jgi:hypothetical protein